ncbi:MAG: F0F1 ATP synthase subunit gamma [Hyphomicrobiales bacterium]|nr:F0F1 ATP synthase subunit gamma [Hyphomicrobiales bacterium]
METLEDLGRRIGTTRDLKSIVRTMKSLSAVSIHQYETAGAAIAAYQHTIELGLQIALRRRPPIEPQSVEAGKRRTLVVLFGSDHGLCGRFNDLVVDFALARLTRQGIDPLSCLWLVVGARAAARLEATCTAPSASHFLPGSVDGLAATVGTILVELDAQRHEEAFDRAVAFHNRREEKAIPAPTMTRLLPLDRRYLRALARRPWESRCLPTFTIEPRRLFSVLVQQHLFATVYRAGAESMAAEHATRLSAMQAAERNIAQRLEEMNADYRRTRQSAITAELLDLFAGYEAVRGRGMDSTV